MWLETKYANLLSPYMRNFKVKSTSLFQFSCPICGDSQTRTHLARGYLYEKDNKLKYTCHNCGLNWNFDYFLKKVNYALFRQYKLEKLGVKKREDNFNYNDIKEEKKPVKTGIEACFEPLTDKAKAYLKSRKIEKCDDIYSITKLSKLKPFFPDKDIPDDERIIFPIRNRQKEIVGLSARSIDPKNKMRYVLLKLKDEPLIFGLDKIDISKDVYVLEGAIDSLHLNNAVAVNGSDLIKVSEFIPKDKQILIYDNQPRNMEIIKKMISSCDKNYRMVIWPKNLPEKDVNLMVRTYGMEKIESWLSNIYKGMTCKLKIIDWKLR